MSFLPPHLASLLEQLKELENTSAEGREKAAHLLTARIDGKKIIIITKNGNGDAAAAISKARAKLENTHRRMERTLRAVNNKPTIH